MPNTRFTISDPDQEVRGDITIYERISEIGRFGDLVVTDSKVMSRGCP